MSSFRVLTALSLLLSLAACDSAAESDAGPAAGTWAGTAQFVVDSAYVDQNYHFRGDYQTRYEFDLEQDGTLVVGVLRQYNTGSLNAREAGVRDTTITWDNDLVQAWPVYGTYVHPILELDLPQAEAAGVFPKDLWTFTVVGTRAMLDATVIKHGYPFSVFENGGGEHTFVFSPTKQAPFEVRRQ